MGSPVRARPRSERPVDECDDRIGHVALAIALALGRRRVKNQPMWAWKKPSSGECGSPSSSEWAWCFRWLAAQSIARPWTAIEPRIRKITLTALTASKLRCVSSRWKPTVMPSPVSTYKAKKSASSRPPIQSCQSKYIAYAVASSGPSTNTIRMLCLMILDTDFSISSGSLSTSPLCSCSGHVGIMQWSESIERSTTVRRARSPLACLEAALSRYLDRRIRMRRNAQATRGGPCLRHGR